jgi:tail assembly chaperone
MTFGASAAGLSSLAARLLGWRPVEFWAATPAELLSALGEPQDTSQEIERDEMARLMARFPDRTDDGRAD